MDANIETLKVFEEIAKVLSVTAMLWLALYGNLKGWWVSGREFKAKCDDNDKLRTERDAALASRDALSDAAAHALDRIAAGASGHAPADR